MRSTDCRCIRWSCTLQSYWCPWRVCSACCSPYRQLVNGARVPLAIVAVGAALTVFVTKESGEKLSAVSGTDQGTADPVAKLVREHSERANLLFIFAIIFAVLAVAA